MDKNQLKTTCNKCGKIDSRECLKCEVIKKILRPTEKKHDIIHHDGRKWIVTAETDLAKKATQEELAKKAAEAAEADDTDSELTKDEEENSGTTELAKAIGTTVSSDEVREKFKEKHIFRNHEGRLWRLFSKFIDCWSITKISKANQSRKQDFQQLFQRRIKRFLEMSNTASHTNIITPDKFKKTLRLG